MGRTSYAGVAIFLLSFCFCHNSALDIPSQKDFLCSIFNATEKELAVIVAKFSLTGHVSLNEIKIIQYTADGGNYSATLSDPEGLKAINLDSDQKIVIITHGFWSSGTTDWVVNMATAYHGIGIRNTLAVDWAEPASTINYVGSARATLNVGRLVAEWLVSYLENNATLIQNLHLVGHSLGAHISAFIGQTIYNLTDVKVGRISGLDVAAPLFEYPKKLSASMRFSADDAEEVEAYHTDKHLLGFASAVAKQDFLVNYGGPIQPSCKSESNIIEQIECSHGFSHELFINTIKEEDYYAKKCSSSETARLQLCNGNLAVIMGEFNNGTSEQGTFYGNTDSVGDPKDL
ncbi:lipase member H-B [Dendroctonus ponderosae]|uniref:Lipase domain-containing protein n=1 Tax=Dendroctonus ponderosae TaxID=77166 RepID=U4UW27_DENPD|nr:lipase member H-B [Dendroctonus ponderosae]XP_048526631.1 lipase member H-B [Dendroctonus ponderosae]ERL94425.1 hypothetical protein D910_11703 [Dendroctonus ponderosae]KAH1027960.1 hypothetical protein HUJ05_001374 [Dendroctonus ponderosae]